MQTSSVWNGSLAERICLDEVIGIEALVWLAVGAIAKRPALINGELQEREHLCLTISFNHGIIDGAPGARFTSRFAEQLSSGNKVRKLMNEEDPESEV